MSDFYWQGNLNPKVEDYLEYPNPVSVMETTGYEKIEKTIDRLMVAGLNLYDVNRNAVFQGDDPEGVDKGKPYMSKWSDSKDVAMRMREIQRRLRHKVANDYPGEDTADPGGEIIADDAKADVKEG